MIGWDGAVVGVVRSKLARLGEGEDSPGPEMVNYAVKTAYLRPLLDDLPDLGRHRPVPAKLSGEALIAEARKAVFMIVVEQ